MQEMAALVQDEGDQVAKVVLGKGTANSKYEEFSGKRIYERMLAQFIKNKGRQLDERNNKIKKVQEEKTEWYRLLALQKGEPPTFNLKKFKYDKDEASLNKLEAHLNKQNKFEHDAVNDNIVEIREGIVKQNDQQMNKIIDDIKKKGEPVED